MFKKTISKKTCKRIFIALLVVFFIAFIFSVALNLSITWQVVFFIFTVLLAFFVFFLTLHKDDIIPIVSLLITLILISVLIYIELKSFEDIITLAFSIVCDIIINEKLAYKEQTIKAKYDTLDSKPTLNASYIEFYFNYKKTITRIFLYMFSLSIICTKQYINPVKLDTVFFTILFACTVSTTISLLIIEFILKNESMIRLFQLRKENHKLPDAEESVSQFSGKYTSDEVEILEGRFNYTIKIKEIRSRIYALIIKDTFEKEKNKPIPIKHLDEILTSDKNNYSDSYKNITIELQKIKSKMEKENINKANIESIDRCIKALEAPKKEA
ncbi:MAG: cytochrome d ubiquinol oxidase subunit II [Ruminococcus sp.]|nr:cytochrome d ubiquinol oxidase subunit II [Ruminococcus sp.]